jgi:DNA ligase 4
MLQKESMYDPCISNLNSAYRSVINRRQVKRIKREYQLIGETDKSPSGPIKVANDKSSIFSGRSFCAFLDVVCLIGIDIMTPSEIPVSRTKLELESLVKSHGGLVFQSENAQRGITVIAEKSLCLCIGL